MVLSNRTRTSCILLPSFNHRLRIITLTLFRIKLNVIGSDVAKPSTRLKFFFLRETFLHNVKLIFFIIPDIGEAGQDFITERRATGEATDLRDVSASSTGKRNLKLCKRSCVFLLPTV